MLWNEFDDLSMQDVGKKKKSYYDMVWHYLCYLSLYTYNEDLLTNGSIKYCVCYYYWMNLLEKGWSVKHLVRTRDNLDPKY